MDYESLNRIRNIISNNTPSHLENKLFPQENIMSPTEAEQRRIPRQEPGFMGKLGAAAAGVSGNEYSNLFGDRAGANYQLGLSSVDALH